MALLTKTTPHWGAFALFLLFLVGLSSQSLAMTDEKGESPTLRRRLGKESIPVTFDPSVREWLSRSYPNGSGAPRLTFLITVQPEGTKSQSGLKSWRSYQSINYEDRYPEGCGIDLTKLQGDEEISIFRDAQGTVSLDCTITGERDHYRGWAFNGFSLAAGDLNKPFSQVLLQRVQIVTLAEKAGSILTGEGGFITVNSCTGNFEGEEPQRTPSSPVAIRVASPTHTMTWSAWAYSWTVQPVHTTYQSWAQWMWPPRESAIR